MSKIEINKEIVLMRQIVRQARLCVVRKLIKDVKLFGLKHGSEKQQQKYKRRIDRLSEELLAAKKIKIDDASKFAITNARSQEEVLADANSDVNTRVMIKLAYQKILLDRVIKFKEKFPNYKEHLGPGKKKLMALKWKADKKLKKGMKKGDEQESGDDKKKVMNTCLENDHFSNNNSIENEDIEDMKRRKEPIKDETDMIVMEREKNDNTLDDDNVSAELESILNTKPIDSKSKIKDTLSVDKKCIEKLQPNRCNKDKIKKEPLDENKICDSKYVDKQSKSIKAVNKEATVKRFTELLQEENVQNNRSQETVETESMSELKLEKEVDSFFMTSNGESEYLSIVVPKPKISEKDSNDNNEDEKYDSRNGFNGHKFSNDRNKFFINLGKFAGKNEKVKNDRSGNNRNGWSENEVNYEQKRPRKELNYEKNLKGRDSANNNEKSDENIHPSWEAKKKQQDILKQGFQGKKIVFNDD